jgi:putative ABC transport system permease protein
VREHPEINDGVTRWVRIVFRLRRLASVSVEWLRELLHDFHYAARVCGRHVLVTALALAALALAIGAATGIFSVVSALLLRNLPFHDPSRLVIERRELPRIDADQAGVDAWRHESAYLEDIAPYGATEMNLGTDHDAGRITVVETTANFFALLGTEPMLGRAFDPEENAPGNDSVVVIAHGVWQQLFGGDPRVLGALIHLNGVPLTVVGVAPPGFDYPEKAAAWTPTYFDFKRLPKPGSRLSYTIGRLKPGVTPALANDLYDTELRRAFPEMAREPKSLRWMPLQEQLAGPVGQASLVLMGVAAFVMLIAGANVAQLLISHSAGRRREFVIRAALGATRARLLRQLIAESLFLTLVAAGSGLGVAHWSSRLAATAQPARLSAQHYGGSGRNRGGGCLDRNRPYHAH